MDKQYCEKGGKSQSMIPRMEYLDLAKGIAVLFMIQVHLMEVFARPGVLNSLIGKISLFLGGPLVAPVFLTIFGFLLANQSYSVADLLLRGGKLIVFGLLLNIGLNFNLLIKIHAAIIDVNQWEYLLGVDILLSAGLGILILTIVRIFYKASISAYLITALFIVLVTPYVSSLITVNTYWKYPLAFIGGKYSWSYFPLFPWLAYTLVGYAFSLYVQRLKSEFEISQRLKRCCFLFLSLSVPITAFYVVPNIVDLDRYYHHGLSMFLWNICLLTFWLWFLWNVENEYSNMQPFKHLKWLGRNVTVSYAIQWLIIGNIGTNVFKTQGLDELIVWFFLVILAVISAIFIWRLIWRSAH
jgi:uncharacterized membrane protein